jgi:trimeric autotransporter adhesin
MEEAGMWTKIASCLLACVPLLLSSPADGLGQQFTGGIRGIVRDPQGVIPGVTVTATNEGTTIARETVTNDVGEYNFPALPPATYSLRTSVAGYKTFERRGIRIGTQQFVTIDVTLEVGAIEESITVTADAPLLETANASHGGVLNRETLESLPAPGRNAFLIGVTIPTVVSVGEPRFNRQQDQIVASQISLGGGGVRANNYVFDGVPITDITGRAVINPTIEALEDVKVQVHTFDAEMGRTGGGVFNTTAKSGTNRFRGTGFFQTRPVWGLSLEYFAAKRGETKESTNLNETYYRLYGGGVGGPVVRNRTFFWTALEGYRSRVLAGQARTWPSARQRVGDFSTTTVRGEPFRLFNPYCRGGVTNAKCPATGTGSLATGGEFTSAIIPPNHPAANPVAFKMAGYWPQPLQSNEDSLPNVNTTISLVDVADMWTFKGEHKITDAWSISGFFAYNRTEEPGFAVVGDELSFLEPGANWLIRHPKVFVVNNTNVLNDATVMSLRIGYTTFPDGRHCRGGAPNQGCFNEGLASLGFNSVFVNAVAPAAKNLFPLVNFENFSTGGQHVGIAPIRWASPYTVNAAVTRLVGRHTWRVGGDIREMGVETNLEHDIAGTFNFDRLFTAGPGRVGGYDFASFLLGVPTSGSIPVTRGEGKYFFRYYATYIQDDWRVNSRFTLNYGLRLEHEDGMREKENRITVGFDPNATNAEMQSIEAAARVNGYTGPPLRGGLIFAGVNGASEQQGNPPAVKLSPRAGATWALSSRTVLRGGYGLFWAPWQFTQTDHGTIGFTRRTELNQSAAERDVPLTSLDNPFPNGLQPITGSSLGILTGLGGNVAFVDQNKGAPKVHQYAVDVQREMPGEMSVSVAYMGATGRDIGFGGTTSVPIELNQINPASLRHGAGRWDAAALRQSVPNPFFGVSGMGELSRRPTVLAGQLIRPFPQFLNVSKLQTTEGGRRQYHAVVFKLDKRTAGWWGGRFNYTWSRMKDNQWGEVSTFGTRQATPQNYYDLEPEYAISIIDTPHRVVLAPIVRIPGPSDRSMFKRLFDGWSATAVMEFTSGPPATAYNMTLSDANLGLFGGLQRPNVAGASPETGGNDLDRIASADHPTAAWFNRAAYVDPGPGAFGNLSRTDPRARYPFRRNADVVFIKDTNLKGGQTAQVRFEILNLTNTPMFGGASTDIGRADFGRIATSRGFPRVWQLSFRYTF